MERALTAVGVVILAAIVVFVLRDEDEAVPAATQAAAVVPPTAPPGLIAQVRASEEETAAVIDRDRAGGLRLEGLVLDAEGLVVPRAAVTVSTHPPREVITEDDGSFGIDGLIGRDYTLVARAASGIGGPLVTRLTATSEPVILRLRAGATVAVEVVDADGGAPLPGAKVELRALEVLVEVADAAGKATFGPVVPGRYQVSAEADGRARAFVPVLAAPATPTEVRVALRRGAAVEGIVRSDDGPVAGAAVSWAGASDWTASSHPRHDAAVTDDKGRFRFEALPGGSFRFTAVHESHAPGSSPTVVLDGVSARRDVEIRLEAGAVLRGRVVSSAGEALGGALVRVGQAQQGFSPEPARATHADDGGRFELRGLPRRILRAHASHERGATDRVEVDLAPPPHEREIVLTVTRTETIEGTVVDAAGEPIEAAQVVATPRPRDGNVAAGAEHQVVRRDGVTALADAGGRFVLRGLAAGSVHELRATPAGGERFRRDRLRGVVEATAGQRGVVIRVPGDGAIRGKVAFPDGKPATVFVVELNGGETAPFVSDDGSFRLADVPPARYTLTVRGPGFLGARVPVVEVRPDATTDVGTVAVRRGSYLAGVVLHEGRPVSGATVRAGSALYGTGSSIAVEGPRGGAGMETTSGEDGGFVFTGIGAAGGVVIAEHPTRGRSQPVEYGGRGQSVDGVVLELEGFGALEGRVTRDGEALPRVTVTVQSLKVDGLGFTVSSGADGGYRFDRLAPGRYKVSAALGSFTSGMSFHSVEGTVKGGEATRLDLAVEGARLTLEVKLEPTNAESYRFSFVNALSGAHEFASAGALGSVAARGDLPFSAFALSFAGAPASIAGLNPGEYTVCATTLPNELGGASEMQEYYDRTSAELAVQCRQIRVAPEPERQELTLAIVVPPYVPAAAAESELAQ
jgi:uncharacterized GH25 family protein